MRGSGTGLFKDKDIELIQRFLSALHCLDALRRDETRMQMKCDVMRFRMT